MMRCLLPFLTTVYGPDPPHSPQPILVSTTFPSYQGMEEQEFDEILTYLSKNKYPESIKSKDSRSNWRKKCRPFTYCKDELYYNHKKYGVLQVVKGIKEKRKIIECSHLQSDGRHHGINRT